MACISKLAGGFAYDCDTGATGFTSAIIINIEDIASFTISTTATTVSELTLKSGTFAYKIDTPKRTLVMSESLRVNEGAPNAFAHAATLVATGLQTVAFIAQINSILNGSFVILTKDVKNVTRVYGLYYGMTATSVERSSHDNGAWYTIAMATPEQFIGEDVLGIPGALYDTLYSAALN